MSNANLTSLPVQIKRTTLKVPSPLATISNSNVVLGFQFCCAAFKREEKKKKIRQVGGGRGGKGKNTRMLKKTPLLFFSSLHQIGFSRLNRGTIRGGKGSQSSPLGSKAQHISSAGQGPL